MDTNTNTSEPKLDDPSEIADMNRRQLKIGLLMQEVGLAGLLELKQRLEQRQPLNLTADQSRDLLEAGRKMERAALGLKEPTDADEGTKKPN